MKVDTAESIARLLLSMTGAAAPSGADLESFDALLRKLSVTRSLRAGYLAGFKADPESGPLEGTVVRQFVALCLDLAVADRWAKAGHESLVARGRAAQSLNGALVGLDLPDVATPELRARSEAALGLITREDPA
jgi:hypothetical protein